VQRSNLSLGTTRAKKNRGREVYPLPAVGSAA
jgi:hypothetical protein